MTELNLNIDNVDTNTIESNLEWAQDRIAKLSDIVSEDLLFLWHLPHKDTINITLSANLIQEIISLLQSQSGNSKLMISGLKSISQAQNIKFPDLMKDLRILITGKADGPPVLELINILGPDKVVYRLKHFIGE